MAGPLTLTLSFDVALLEHQLRQLKLFLEQMPKRRGRRFARKAYRLVALCDLRQVGRQKFGHAALAGDLALQVRVDGMDELIAAAMRASKLECAFHG